MNRAEQKHIETAISVLKTTRDNRDDSIVHEESEPEIIFLGDIIDCHTCQAYLDGIFRQRGDGFCPACGTHLATLKEAEKRKFKLQRHYANAGCYE